MTYVGVSTMQYYNNSDSFFSNFFYLESMHKKYIANGILTLQKQMFVIYEELGLKFLKHVEKIICNCNLKALTLNMLLKQNVIFQLGTKN